MDPRVTAAFQKYQLDKFMGPEGMDKLTVHCFEKGEALCEVGEPVRHLYFLVEGRVKIFLPMKNARQLLLCFYEPLQLFGDIEIFEPEPLATATIEALTPCVCLGLAKEVILTRMTEDPRFLKQLCISLGRKLGRVIQNSALNLLHPLENRVASYILATATVQPDQRLSFSGNLTHTADLLGASFRHLHRTLQTFCDEGILTKEKNGYTVQKINELERRAAGIYIVR
ncbi:MAG: cyclic nucleotide-binding domain-containing protein [Blastocatellia bacterium]|nr:cyclic nucleotide-binding domain-containing protein [Blastocatellia bacterium]